MDRIAEMNIFVAVAREEGFSSAARKLKLSPPVVTRAIADLENHLGVKLLTRTTRYVKLTDAGHRYLSDAKRILEDIQEAEESAAGVNSTPTGQLNITAPVMFGRLYVLPLVIKFLETFSEMSVNCMFVDRVVNMMEEGIDVGIRIGELPDSSLRSLPVGNVCQVVCGSPGYLKKHGIPKHPKDLARHQIILSTGISSAQTWRFTDQIQVRLSPSLKLNSNDSAVEAMLSGFGLSRLLSYQVSQQLNQGSLKKVLGKYEPPKIPIHIVHREGRLGSSKIRCFVDLLAENLRKDNSLNI